MIRYTISCVLLGGTWSMQIEFPLLLSSAKFVGRSFLNSLLFGLRKFLHCFPITYNPGQSGAIFSGSFTPDHHVAAGLRNSSLSSTSSLPSGIAESIIKHSSITSEATPSSFFFLTFFLPRFQQKNNNRKHDGRTLKIELHRCTFLHSSENCLI